MTHSFSVSLASSNWTWLTNVTPVSSPQLFIDTTKSVSDQRFYRVRQGP